MGETADLSPLILRDETVGHNISAAHPLSNLYQAHEDARVQSAVGAQFVITISFQHAVNLTAIKVGGSFSKESPSVIKLWVNRLATTLDDVDCLPPVETLVVAESAFAGGAAMTLNAPAFEKVISLTLFVAANHGALVTSVCGLKLLGHPAPSGKGRKMVMHDY